MISKPYWILCFASKYRITAPVTSFTRMFSYTQLGDLAKKKISLLVIHTRKNIFRKAKIEKLVISGWQKM